MSIPGPAGITGFNADKCTQRNRLASLRHLQEAAPMRFNGGPGASGPGAGGMRLFGSQVPEGILLDSKGDLPATEEEALTRIRALQPAGADPLGLDDIYIHYPEAANSNYISDRFVFLGSGTLANIATGGILGVAFMNSHRTGGFSSESELPFGRTFAGRYEQYMTPTGQIFERSILGFYMLRGSRPTGDSGPSTDEIHRMIQGAVLRDVSVGIGPGVLGTRICDVCGNVYYSRDCEHYAGSTYGMSQDQKTAQISRGVLTGVATYTLENWEIGELSGVYDGAVPGAGFAKAHEALQSGLLPDDAAAELALVYAAYL